MLSSTHAHAHTETDRLVHCCLPWISNLLRSNVSQFDWIRGKTITFDSISITNDKRQNSECVLYMQFLSNDGWSWSWTTVPFPLTQPHAPTVFYLIIFVCFTLSLSSLSPPPPIVAFVWIQRKPCDCTIVLRRIIYYVTTCTQIILRRANSEHISIHSGFWL